MKNPAAEEALIGIALTQGDKPEIPASHFADHRHQWIWEAIEQEEHPDYITVTARLKKNGHDLSALVSKYAMGTFEFWNADKYASQITDAYNRRQGLEIASRIAKDCHDPTVDINEIASLSDKLSSLSTVEDKSKPLVKIISDVTDSVLDRIERIGKGEKIEVGYQTGIGYIDRNFRGLKKGWLIYEAGSPSIGKTWKATQMSAVFARQDPGDYVALEGSEESMAYRMLSGVTGIDPTRIEFGDIDGTLLLQALAKLEDLSYNYFYAPRLSVQELRAYISKQKSERDIGWIVIDYVSLLTAPGNTKNEIDNAVSKELRRMASEFNVLIYGLDSITKAGANNKVLSLSDIEGVFSKQHDADITFGYTDYKVIDGIAPEIDDFERKRNCRLLGILKDRHRDNRGKIMPLELVNGLVDDFKEDEPYVAKDWSK